MMLFNTIIWRPKGCLDVSQNGMVIDHNADSKIFYEEHRAKLTKSVLLVGESWSKVFTDKYPEITDYYIDESMVNGKFNFHSREHDNPKIVFGEPDLDYLRKYKPFKCQVTFTAYRDYIKIFGIRIPLCWTNQINVWKKMQTEFWDRFNVCWISINKNKKDYEKLIEWAYSNGKEIWLFVEDNVTKEELTEALRSL